MSAAQAAREAGFPEWMCSHPTREIKVEEIVAELQGTLAEHAIEASLIDAAEIHEYLTECIRADMRDIRNDDGSFKPQSEWPPIWGRMMEAGDVDVERSFARSSDGETKDKRGGWDEAGTVTKVKLKFGRKSDLVKLAMQHKAVNAMVEAKQGDINIVVVTAEKARQVAGARKRLAKVVDIQPELPKDRP